MWLLTRVRSAGWAGWWRTLALIALLAMLCADVQPATAQERNDDWHPLGPDGGQNAVVVVHPADSQQLFAYQPYSYLPLYYSADGGEQWRPISAGRAFLTFFVVAPAPPHPLFLGIADRLLTSERRGQPWRPLSSDLTMYEPLLGMAISPEEPNRYYVHSGRQLLRSDDAGATWREIGTNKFSIMEFAVSPLDADLLYVKTEGRLLRSLDGGQTWQTLDGPYGGCCGGIAVSPFQRATLFADGDGTVVVSRDSGQSWQALEFDGNSPVFHPTDPQTLYGLGDYYPDNLFITRDGGENWRVMPTNLPHATTISHLTIDPADPNVLYASAYETDYDAASLYKSTDAGATWRIIDAGIYARSVRAFAYSSEQAYLYALSERSLYRWERATRVWEPRRLPVDHVDMARIAVDPESADRVFLQTQFTLYRSEEGGMSWAEVWPFVDTQPLETFIILPTTPATLVVTPGQSRVYISTDGGRTWEQTLGDAGGIAPGYHCRATSLAYDPRFPAEVYFFSRLNLYQSLDGGNNWRQVTSIPVVVKEDFTWCDAPLAVEAGTGALWLGVEDALWRSDDEGATWETLQTPQLNYVYDLNLSPGQAGLAAVLTGDQLLLTDNGGFTWLIYPQGEFLPPSQVAFDPGSIATLTLASFETGLYTTTVNVADWFLPLTAGE